MAILIWIRQPRLLFARLKYWWWERRNPEKPWMCPGTIDFCQQKLSKSMHAMEFGSGRSTLWFASMVGQLTSIEHDATWHALVARQLAEAGIRNVDYRHIPLDHALTEPERPSYDPMPAYVASADAFRDRSLNFVVVDGHYRTHCVRRVLPKIAPGGLLLVDDVNLWSSIDALNVPAEWTIVDDSTNGIKRCVVWQAPSDTKD